MTKPGALKSTHRQGAVVRLLPLVMVAGVFLLALKGAGMIFHAGQFAGAIAPAHAQEAEAKKAASPGAKEDVKDAAAADKGANDAAKTADAKPAGESDKAAGDNTAKRPKDVTDDPRRFLSSSERAVLESLAKRRKAIDGRERALKMRENLLKAAEQRIEGRIAELKTIEQRINERFTKEEKRKNENLKDLVSLYENMKPKDAARIFNRLDMDVLVDLAGQIKPRKMSSVLAKMNAQSAERLTIELAARAYGNKSGGPARLPRIKDANPG